MADQNLGDEALRRLSDIQRVGQLLYQREAERLALKHGVDDPRTLRIINAANGAKAILDAIEIAREDAPAQVKAEQGEAVVYGRVAAEDFRGVADVEIALEDTNGRVMRAAGTVKTDEAGRFTLRVAPAVAEKLAGKEYAVTARTRTGEVLYRSPTLITLERDAAINADARVDLRSRVTKPAPEPRPTEPEPREVTPPAERVTFSVDGVVTKADGKPASGVLVRVFDKDVRYDDLLGAAITNRKGEFRVTYRHQDFAEGETAADLYFVVVDANDVELFSSQDRVMFNAEHAARVDIALTA